jgi:hypothetical protein
MRVAEKFSLNDNPSTCSHSDDTGGTTPLIHPNRFMSTSIWDMSTSIWDTWIMTIQMFLQVVCPIRLVHRLSGMSGLSGN